MMDGRKEGKEGDKEEGKRERRREKIKIKNFRLNLFQLYKES